MSDKLRNILLIVLCVLFLGCGGYFLVKYISLQNDFGARLESSQSALQEAQSNHDALDMSTEAGQAEIAQKEQELLAEAQSKIDALQQEIDEQDAIIAEANATIEENKQQEDYEYYKNVYDSLLKGKTEVEGYIAESEQ